MGTNTHNRLGAFGGVFTPSILTILGVILFMRAGFVIGQGGIFQSLLILALSHAITLLTALSVSAVSTNTPVSGGGAYFLISRVVGPELGGAIGLALFGAGPLGVYLLKTQNQPASIITDASSPQELAAHYPGLFRKPPDPVYPGPVCALDR